MQTVIAKKNKRKRVVASNSLGKRKIMCGAGSAITIEFDYLTLTNLGNMALEDSKVGFITDYPMYVGVSGAAEGTIDIKSIGTYYNGGDINMDDVPVKITIDRIDPDDEDGYNDLIEYGLRGQFDDLSCEKEVTIGGGYTHTTFTGVFSVEAWTQSSSIVGLTIEILDKKLVEWLDRVAHGDNVVTEYEIFADGEPMDSSYENREEAIDDAYELALSGEYSEVFVDEVVLTEDYDGNWDVTDSRIIWNAPEYSDGYEAD